MSGPAAGETVPLAHTCPECGTHFEERFTPENAEKFATAILCQLDGFERSWIHLEPGERAGDGS